MRIPPPIRTQARNRARSGSVVPMINVVFLLLIFFLMTATITPPPPFEVRPPKAPAPSSAWTDAEEPPILTLAVGRAGFAGVEGEAAWATLAAAAPRQLEVRADAAMPAADVAAALARARAAGEADITLTVRPE